MRRKLVAVIAGLTALAVTGGLALAAGTPRAADRARARTAWGLPQFAGAQVQSADDIGPAITTAQRLVLVSRGGTATDVDEPPRGESQGDEFTVSTPLYRPGGRRVGWLDVRGIITRVSRRQVRIMVFSTSSLRHRGEIDAQGVLVFTPRTAELDLGVTGGTGRYQNVRGELHLRFQRQAVKLIYHLLP